MYSTETGTFTLFGFPSKMSAGLQTSQLFFFSLTPLNMLVEYDMRISKKLSLLSCKYKRSQPLDTGIQFTL